MSRANALTVLPNGIYVNANVLLGKMYNVVYSLGDCVITERSTGDDGTNYATRQIGFILAKQEMGEWDKDVDSYGGGYIYYVLLCGKEHYGAIIDVRLEHLRGIVHENDLSHDDQDALFGHCLNTWKENPEDNTELIVDKFPQHRVVNHCGQIKKKYFEEWIIRARAKRATQKAKVFWRKFRLLSH